MEIRSTPGQEVPIYKIQNFIMDLRSKGYPIKMVSTDGYQSTNLRQNLTLEGVETKLISVDRTKDPYNELRNIILEERIRLPNLPKLKKEIQELEDVGPKFDHPVDGSKDILDSVCGSVWSCSQELAGENQARQMKDMSIALHNYLGASSMNASGFEKKLQNFLSR